MSTSGKELWEQNLNAINQLFLFVDLVLLVPFHDFISLELLLHLDVKIN